MSQFSKEKKVFFVIAVLLVACIISVNSILSPFLIAYSLAYFANPLVRYLEKFHINKPLGALCVTIATISIIFLFFFFSIPLIAKQIIILIAQLRKSDFWNNTYQNSFNILNQFFPQIDYNLKGFFAQSLTDLFSLVRNSFESLGELTLSFVKSAKDLVIMLFIPILMYYFTKDWDDIQKSMISLVPRRYLRTFLKFTKDMNSSIFLYLKGQLKVSSILIVTYSLLFSFTKLRFGVILGIMMGISTIIPYIGSGIMSIIITVAAMQEFGNNSKELIHTFIMLIIGQSLDSVVVSPKFMGDSVKLSPVWMIFGVLASGELFGIAGAFFGLPALVVISTFVKNIISLYRNSNYYKKVD